MYVRLDNTYRSNAPPLIVKLGACSLQHLQTQLCSQGAERMPSCSVSMKEPQARAGVLVRGLVVKFSICRAGQETTEGTENSPAGSPSTARCLLHNQRGKEMASWCPLPLLGDSVPSSLLFVSFLTDGSVTGAHSLSWKPPAEATTAACPQVFGLNHLPLFRIHKMTRKRIPPFSRALSSAGELRLGDQTFSRETDRPPASSAKSIFMWLTVCQALTFPFRR